MSHQFKLDPKLATETVSVGNFELCEVRLLNDSRFLWLILVPRRAGISEIYQLDNTDQQLLITESSLASRILMEITAADKINVGALGNLVPQLHWHVVTRRRNDACWPGPVWGCGNQTPYQEEELGRLLTLLKDHVKPR